MLSADVTLQDVDLCARGTYTMTDIWGLNITSKDGRHAMVYNTAMDLGLTITKLKEFGQHISALNMSSVMRVIPSSSNENCTTPTDVTNAISFSYVSPELTANLTLNATEAVVCEIPERGTARGVQLTFTFDFEYGFENVDARRRRRSVRARQTLDMAQIAGSMTPDFNFDVYATKEDMSTLPTSSSNTIHNTNLVLYIVLFIMSCLLL